LKNSRGLKQIPKKVKSASANNWRKNNSDREPIPSDNDGYQADDEPGSEIVWEDDVEFPFSQYQDHDYNYEVGMHCENATLL